MLSRTNHASSDPLSLPAMRTLVRVATASLLIAIVLVPTPAGAKASVEQAGCRIIATAASKGTVGSISDIDTGVRLLRKSHIVSAEVLVARWDGNEANTVDLLKWCRKRFPKDKTIGRLPPTTTTLSPVDQCAAGIAAYKAASDANDISAMLDRRDELVDDCPDEATFVAVLKNDYAADDPFAIGALHSGGADDRPLIHILCEDPSTPQTAPACQHLLP
jgi:hypothetical protein